MGITGHRPDKLGGYRAYAFQQLVLTEIMIALTELDATEGISGMAQGVDTLFCQACTYKNIPYIAAIPFIGQDRVWPADARRLYSRLVAKAISSAIVCAGGYAAWKLQKRNEYIVDNCDILLAVWDGSTGGTYNCIKYACSRDKTIFHIPIYIENGELCVGPFIKFKNIECLKDQNISNLQ